VGRPEWSGRQGGTSSGSGCVLDIAGASMLTFSVTSETTSPRQSNSGVEDCCLITGISIWALSRFGR